MNTLNIENQASKRLATKFANFITSFFTTENKIKSKAPKASYKGESFSSVMTTAQRIGCDMAHFNYIS
ncbi:hypothetical protein [Vibrio diazotrophicus]|uniref:hypothetical protein n=1 Tax=Vibrio diazotrophicus TaxID=685 RepID=UPI0005A97101|nr:hypothetical protein [Vibrio diazotrophicus]PNH95176.1 hypothetical protein C1O24_16505 [Vibrio diazotrophicus]